MCCLKSLQYAIVQAPFHAAYLNAVFGNVFDQRDTLLCTALLLNPGQFSRAMSYSAAAQQQRTLACTPFSSYLGSEHTLQLLVWSVH